MLDCFVFYAPRNAVAAGADWRKSFAQTGPPECGA
jgi:hypothetical protein